MSQFNVDYDVLFNIRNLPEDILNNFGKIIVNRRGSNANAYMITRDIVGHVIPHAVYQLTENHLQYQVNHPEKQQVKKPALSHTTPLHTVLEGYWNEGESTANAGANILGGFGTLILTQKFESLMIEVAETTEEALAFYGATLLKHNDYLSFESDANLPVTKMSIGNHYAENYLHLEDKGGGSFLEYHDRPHFHMPLNQDSGGHLILGKKVNDNILLSAFRIPLGYAIYTPPYVIHTDSYLTGDYLVVYSVTTHYSTVIVKNKNHEIVKLVC